MTKVKRRLPERLTPLAAGMGLRPWYGDLHNHCALSYGHGSLERALTRAARQLDFVSVTGHAHWPDMPVDDPRVAHIVEYHVKGFARLERLWPSHFETLRASDGDRGLTVFPGYEIHSCEFGDYTIILRALDSADIVKADSPAELRAALQAVHGDGAMAFPHHLAYRHGTRGVNWDVLDPALSPVAEIVSMHGLSEASTGERPFLHSMGPGDGRSTVEFGLGLGHVFGFLGNTDHHSGYPGSYGHGRTAIYAAGNARDALWDALRARRTNALTGDCAHLFIALDGVAQGGIVAPGASPILDVEAVAGGFIDCVDLIRNGRLVHRITPDLTPAPIMAEDGSIETLLVLEMGWGSRGASHDWAGSLALSDGEIVAVEPRLRGPEIVAPLEGDDEAADDDWIDCDYDVIGFSVRASANPNNSTPAMQGFAARVRVTPETRVRLTFSDETVTIPVERLLEGAATGTIGAIDGPSWRLHPLPRPAQWQWRGRIPIEPLAKGDHIYARLRQKNGQWAWTSPIFCR
jgi:hypothetical protein